MSTHLNKRGQEGLRLLERELLRRHPDLSDNALTYLLAEGQNTLEILSYAAGDQMDLGDAVAAIKRSEIGQLVFADRDAAPDPMEAAREALKSMTGAQRLSYARANGLA